MPGLHEPHLHVAVVSAGEVSQLEPLSCAEEDVYQTYTGVKKINWQLGRLAGKGAVRSYLDHQRLNYPNGALVEILVAPGKDLPSSYINGVEQDSLLLSISHTKGRYGAAVVASRTLYAGIGLDIELIQDMTPSLVKGFCTSAEYEYWEHQPEGMKPVVATALWTLKEACKKNSLNGPEYHPRHFDCLAFVQNPEGIVVGNQRARWTICYNDSILAVLYQIKT